MSPSLAGLHDSEAQVIAAPDTWILHTVALSENPAPAHLNPQFHWITRLNWGYGSTGTLPDKAHYVAFAEAAARYVASSTGCTRWIIGNETNLPREWPDTHPIYPRAYAECFGLCRDAIRGLPGHARDEVLVAGSGPWNNQFAYPGNQTGDWITYFSDVLRECEGHYDGYALHAYTHGYDPALVTSEAKMDAPFGDRHYQFRTYRDYCAAIPAHQRHKPAYLTEANGDGPWQATGLMPAMLEEIDGWNHAAHQVKIQCVVFYRYPKYDHFYIEGKDDVMAEYQRAVQLGYSAPGEVAPPPQHPKPPPPAGERDRYFDPALLPRGVEVDQPALAQGEQYWFAEHLEWLDRQESGGRHHIYGNVTDESGAELYGVKLKVSWPSGDALIETKPDLASPYSYNYPMSKSLNEFRIEVLDGSHKSELVTGIGMGMDGNPAEHTSTVIRWRLRTHERTGIPTPEPPIQPPDLLPTHTLFHPLPGATITQHMWQNPDAYARFGLAGHNGVDLAMPAGAAIRALADGEVAYVDTDESYGEYVRLWHPALGAWSFYSHLQARSTLKVGDAIKAGAPIGRVGSTGNSSGPHLHFEIRDANPDGTYNPLSPMPKGRVCPESWCALHGLKL